MTKLKHFGILGMKWGRRKSRSSGSDMDSEDHKTSRSIQKKKISEMSNEELKKLTSRLQLEKQLKDLEKTEPGAVKWLADVVSASGKQLASKYVASLSEQGAKHLFEILVKRAG